MIHRRINIPPLHVLLTDARFWIPLLLAVRLINLDYPPYGGHTWRQTMTLGVARNYLEWDANFFKPRTLLCDSRTGIFAQEFPIYNYLVFLGWKLFGQENWVFRLLLLFVNSLGLFWFYQIVKRIFNHRAAILSMILFGTSLMLTYSMKAMPDTFAISLTLGGVLYGWKFLQEKKSGLTNGILFLLLGSLGMLSKIPASAIMTLLLIPFMAKEVILNRKVTFVLLSLISLVIVICWYFFWIPWAEHTYGHQLFFPRTIIDGVNELLAAGDATGAKFESSAFRSRIVFYICAIGLLTLMVKGQRLLLSSLLAFSLVFFYFMVKAGDVFSAHDYYVLPYIPALAICGGFAVDLWLPQKKWILPIVLFVFTVMGIWSQINSFKMGEKDKLNLRLESICSVHIPPDARILTTEEDGNPTMLYFCHSKGWSESESWKNEGWIAIEAEMGMEYVVVQKFQHNARLSLPLVYEDSDFVIYKTY